MTPVDPKRSLGFCYSFSMTASPNPCVFCAIVDGSACSSEVFRDESCVAFLDTSPVNPGHILICPTRHVTSFIDLVASELSAITAAAQRIAQTQLATLPNCSGFNLLLSEGADAGQEVPHVHLHVVPRGLNDGFGWKRFGSPKTSEELDAIAALLSDH